MTLQDKLKMDIEQELPEFARMIKETKEEVVILHQDAFAVGYQESEYILLGKAIKYAGIFGVTLTIIGKK